MKRLFIIGMISILSCAAMAHGDGVYENSDFFGTLKAGDKAAILMVHFGTTHDDTRTLTIDAINKRVKTSYPDTELREAYTSRIVIKRLQERGIRKQNPVEALKQLHTEGYTHLLIQPSTLINGVEMKSLEGNVAEFAGLFKEIRIGNPLLYAPEDYSRVIEILTKDNLPQRAYLWVGHGTYDPSTAQYAMLDYMLKEKGHRNCMVGTIEGYPSFENALSQLKASGLKRIVMLPFMLVAGDHAKNDIAGEWKEKLEQAGFTVEVRQEGLGQYPPIQEVYLSHLQFIAKHRKIDIQRKKKLYEKTGEVL